MDHKIKCYCETDLPNNSEVSSVCLKDLSIFDSVNDNDFEIFKDIGMRKTFLTGEALFIQGAPINEVFAIKAGRIRLSKVLEDGSERVPRFFIIIKGLKILLVLRDQPWFMFSCRKNKAQEVADGRQDIAGERGFQQHPGVRYQWGGRS
jgi:hypothetical protein